MKTKITLYGEVAGNIWMPAVECTKTFHLELTRIPRNSTTRTYPGISPRSMDITCLRDALLHSRMMVTSSPVPSLGHGWRSRITLGAKLAAPVP